MPEICPDKAWCLMCGSPLYETHLTSPGIDGVFVVYRCPAGCKRNMDNAHDSQGSNRVSMDKVHDFEHARISIPVRSGEV